MYLLIFLIGASIGSFVCVVVERRRENRNYVKGRSTCDSCNRTIPFYLMIPVFSYIFLKGRCKYCNEKINVLTFVCEVAGGIIFLILYFIFGLSFELIMWTAAIFTYMCVFFSDLLYMDIYTTDLIFVTAIEVIIFRQELLTHLLSGALLIVVMGIIYIGFKGKTGLGDVYLAFPLGFLTEGILSYYSLCFGYVLGAIYGIILLIKKKKKDTKIPLGSFLILGAFINLGVIFWRGNNLYLMSLMKEFLQLK